MRFLLAFCDPAVLLGAGPSAMAGRFPHLRLVSLLARPEIEPLLGGVPAHVRGRIILDASPELLTSGAVKGVLTSDRAATVAMLRTMFPHIQWEDTVTWEDVAHAYAAWMQTSYLPYNREYPFTPEGLFPLDWGGGRARH